MQKSTLKVTLPDGTTKTRWTSRPYTHAVIGMTQAWNETEPHWHVDSFTQNPTQALRSAGSKGYWTHLRIVEIDPA